jgi:hypothetical protein
MAAENANLDSSLETVERIYQEVRSLLVKAHSTIERVQDVSILESTSVTTAGIIEGLALKDDGEDPLVAAMHRQVTTGSEFVFSMLMMHEVECDFKKITSTYPKGKDGHDKSPKDFLERARDLANCLAFFLWRGTPSGKLPESRGARGRVLPPASQRAVPPRVFESLDLVIVSGPAGRELVVDR